jgi:zinc transporter, ZIP family
MRVLAVAAVLCLAGAVAVGVARPWSGHHASGVSVETLFRRGGFAVVVTNESADTVRIAQVTVNDAFVGFTGHLLTIPPHQRTRLLIDYAWVKGEPYEIGVLTSGGGIIQSEVGGAEGS